MARDSVYTHFKTPVNHKLTRYRPREYYGVFKVVKIIKCKGKEGEGLMEIVVKTSHYISVQ